MLNGPATYNDARDREAGSVHAGAPIRGLEECGNIT